MKILLAIDESIFSQAATKVVVQQMRPGQTELCVLHVVEPLSNFPYVYKGQAVNLKALQQERVREGRELVQRVGQLLSKAGFKVQRVVEEGDPRSAIIDQAARGKADLIIVGSHGKKGLSRFMLGSVAEYVARYARCSVMIVRVARARGRSFARKISLKSRSVA
jgi:universal stress protein A